MNTILRCWINSVATKCARVCVCVCVFQLNMCLRFTISPSPYVSLAFAELLSLRVSSNNRISDSFFGLNNLIVLKPCSISFRSGIISTDCSPNLLMCSYAYAFSVWYVRLLALCIFVNPFKYIKLHHEKSEQKGRRKKNSAECFLWACAMHTYITHNPDAFQGHNVIDVPFCT